MDLRLMTAAPTEQERAAVDAVLGPPVSGWTGGERTDVDARVARGGRTVREQRHLLLPVLHSLQSTIGWISEGGLSYVSERLTVPPAEAYGVASFYAMFSTTPRPPLVVHVCDDVACLVVGAEALCADLERTVGPAGSASADGRSTWLRSPCLGICEQAPAILAQRSAAPDVALGGASVATFSAVTRPGADIVCAGGGGAPQTWDPAAAGRLRLLRRVNLVDPMSLDSYRSHGGYAALRAAHAVSPEGVIREVRDAKLLGRGGAAFPAGVKWEAVARQPERPHYLVCNADESEPGTFKDRIVMEQDPFSVIESMTIAAFATGCEQGYLYIRGEYPLATERIIAAIDQAKAKGFLGDDVMGEGFRFDIEIRRGAGAYICGEETALFNSIEGYRGEPRNKPPFPVTHGLFGKPTVVNNVETLINVLDIVLEGGPAFAATGTPDSTGTRLFCLSGCIATPGLYEAPFGITLGEVLDMAGGIRDGRPLQAVLLGGAAGAFVGPDMLGLKLTFEDTRAAGVTLGSGVVMAFDDTVDLKQILVRIARFFRDESCGQCVPCRVGTVRQEELLQRMISAHTIGTAGDEVQLLNEIAQAMRDASICGLGQTAANAIGSAITRLDVFGLNGKAAAPS